jgi:hypothetical protein
MMTNLIYNDQGSCIARVVNGEIFSEAANRKIGTTREGNFYGLTGELIGHFASADLVLTARDSTPDALTKLLNER